ncbi:MAG: phosphoglycerate mutase family protein, partial [Salinisphaera sp.]|nr:phosphoglycerate mutase family protein [Salinisphaera sp.]
MTILTLVRHGQASWGQRDYDVLSPMGEQQARITGLHLARIGSRPDALLAGGMRRQRHTAALVGAAWGSAVDDCLPAFNEYDAGQLFKAYMPAVLMENAELA